MVPTQPMAQSPEGNYQAPVPSPSSDGSPSILQPGVENALSSASDSAAPATPNVDFSRSLADSGNRSSGGAGSDLLRNSVAFQGDDFGNPGGSSTIFGQPINIPTNMTGKMKLAENVSPLPQNRIFLNYSLFNNVPLSPDGVTVNRITPGFERTFWNNLASIEVRTPIASTLDSNINLDGTSDTSNGEFGNIFFAFKGILLSNDCWAISAGTSISVPTADNTSVYDQSGSEVLRIVNQSVHIMPFLGGVYTPTRRSFFQGVLQVDIDASGNDVLAQSFSQGPLNNIGKLQDSTFLYTDIAFGYWLMKRDRCDRSFVQGIVPVIEGHWNRSLNDADLVTDGSGDFEIQPVIRQLDVLNVLTGVTFQLRNNSRFSLGYVVPVGNGADRVFDSEARVTWNKYY